MLEAIRKRSASIVVKGLLGLLILSFIGWAVADYIAGRGQAGMEAVAHVGDQQIAPYEFSDAYRRQLQRMQQVLGPSFDVGRADALGLRQSVLAGLVRESLFTQAARDLGLAVSDDLVRREIQNDPAFRDEFGQFDRVRFQQVIHSIGYNEARYVAALRNDLGRAFLLASLGAAARVPAPQVAALYTYRNEKRLIEAVRIGDDAAPAPAQPSDADLRAYYDENQRRFTAPEYRALTFILVDADDLAGEMAVSEVEIQDAFEQRQAEFASRETRTLRQILVDDAETAQKVAARVRTGEDFAKVAKEVAGQDADSLELGTLTREQVALPELVEPAFALAAGETSEPVQTVLGWHILQATAAEAGKPPALAEVRDELKKAVAKDKAVDALFDLANRLEDTLAGGATLEEAARSLNLAVVSIDAVDGTGRRPDGQPVEGMPEAGNFVGVAFDTPEAQESQLTEAGDDAYFILRVDRITPPVLKPFETVRNDVVAGWTDAAKADAAETAAKALAAKASAAADLKALADASGYVYLAPQEVSRTGAASGDLSAALIRAVFEAERGTPVSARGPNGAYVARVTDIRRADAQSDANALQQLADGLAREFAADIQAQLARGLESKFPVSVNQRALTEAN